VQAFNVAVSNKRGSANFTRVLGNTTSSHLTGSKTPYGELETFAVELADIKELIPSADLIKMDVEGHEKEIILAVENWKNTDAIIEIGNNENAQAIYDHLTRLQVNAFAQKIGWKRVEKLEDMPTSHRDGSLFITSKDGLP
ncbi:MAG: FkbM family methyltransferase, partial [Chlamydiia bacterium]|nr:FkbM family methyltransferase [Chlamydiia bacterium]